MSRAARLLLLALVLGTVIGLSKVHAVWVANPAYDYTGSSRFGWSLAYIVTLYITAYGVGLPDLPRTWRSAVASSAAAAVLAAGGVSVLQLLTGDTLLPRFVVFGTAILVIPSGAVANAVARGGSSRAEQRDRVILVGGRDELTDLCDDLRATPLKPASVAAHLEPGEAAAPGSKALVAAAERAQATVVVLAREAQADDRVVAQVAEMHERGVRVRTLSLFYEEWLGKLPLAELERVSLLFDIGELHRARYGRVKRVLDTALASVALVPFGLLIPMVVVANLVGNRGPLFYRQERVGRFGSRFSILKFRTMASDDGAGPTSWTTVDDSRVTRFGRILRRTHLDELPQVVNILRGDLSVVGPRPEQPRYVEELTEKLPFYQLRHLVRPGLTGWAQVEYGYAGDEHGAMEKLQYEFFYLRHQGLRFDLRIVGRTLRTILGSKGRGR